MDTAYNIGAFIHPFVLYTSVFHPFIHHFVLPNFNSNNYTSERLPFCIYCSSPFAKVVAYNKILVRPWSTICPLVFHSINAIALENAKKCPGIYNYLREGFFGSELWVITRFSFKIRLKNTTHCSLISFLPCSQINHNHFIPVLFSPN